MSADQVQPPETPLISKSGELPTLPSPSEASLKNLEAGRTLPAALWEERSLICLALRLEGYTYAEIAVKLGVEVPTIRQWCKRGRTSGKFNDTIELLDDEAVPQALDNLLTALRDPKHANHWAATTETLHGRGAFRKFNTNKAEGAGAGDRLPSLNIAIINPQGGGDLPTIIVNSEKGSIQGTGRTDDAFDDA